MTALERVTAVLERHRVAGGWVDEDVAVAVLEVLGLDNDGCPMLPGALGAPAIKPARDPQPDE